jgi:Tfp pilus assembly protein PilP
MRAAIILGLGILFATAPGAHGQTNPATPTPAKPGQQAAAKPGQSAPAPAKPAAQAPAKPTPAPAKPATATPAKPAAQAASKRAAKAKAPAKPAAPKPEKTAAPGTAPTESELRAARRDPFESLIGRQQAAAAASKNLPPGKAGLQVSTLRLDGIVKAPNGMIAVVSNPQARTYFLREGDHLYDGTVEKISMDGVSFHEEGKDAFGKPVERQVNKRIYSSPGEQQ